MRLTPPEQVQEDNSNTVIITTPEQEKALESSSNKRKKTSAGKGEKEEEERFCEFCGKSIVHEPELNRKAASSRRKYCSKECQSRSAQRRANARLNLDASRRHIAKRLRLSDPLFFN